MAMNETAIEVRDLCISYRSLKSYSIKKNLLHFIGSDAHNTHTRKPTLGRCSEFLTKAMGADYMRKIMVRNPRRIIEEDR